MLKSIFKEIAIILLLILTIIILLAVLFYDYIPNNTTVPAKVEAYELSQDVKTELENELNNKNPEEIIKTYQIDTVELEHYEKTKEYNKGKVNPFAHYSSGTGNNNSNASTGNGQTNNSDNNSNASNTNSSTGSDSNNENTSETFLKTTGK